MVNNNLNQLFYSLADPTRRGILERLSAQDLTVTEIAEPYDMSLPAISKHLKILEKAQLISRKKLGREYHIHMESSALKTISDYLKFYTKFWKKQLQNLEQFLSEDTDKENNDKQSNN